MVCSVAPLKSTTSIGAFFFFEMFTACKVLTGIRLSDDPVSTKAGWACTLLIVAVRESDACNPDIALPYHHLWRKWH
jgi:hypothetical protein